jgi:recombination protein RecT
VANNNNANNNVAVFNGPADFNQFLKRLEPQMAMALPSFMKASRITRLAMTVFSSQPALGECSQRSIAASILTACQLGLEPNVNGQGYLIPYAGTCTFVPGWKGLVDLSNRSGRCTVWTGAVYHGDEFDYALGDNPFVRHKPGDIGDEDPGALTHVYAVGKIRGNDVPVIEVWPIAKVWRHRDRFNKVGKKHYSFNHPEMYARKVALLQVLKYMPQSIELTAAMEASHAAERGANVTIDAQTFVVTEEHDPNHQHTGDDGGDQQGDTGAGQQQARQRHRQRQAGPVARSLQGEGAAAAQGDRRRPEGQRPHHRAGNAQLPEPRAEDRNRQLGAAAHHRRSIRMNLLTVTTQAVQHTFQQGSRAWQEHRFECNNASDAAAMLGCDDNRSRTDLLDSLHLGFQPDVGSFKQGIYDEGHRSEGLARPLAEAIMRDELYPLVLSRDWSAHGIQPAAGRLAGRLHDHAQEELGAQAAERGAGGSAALLRRGRHRAERRRGAAQEIPRADGAAVHGGRR